MLILVNLHLNELNKVNFFFLFFFLRKRGYITLTSSTTSFVLTVEDMYFFAAMLPGPAIPLLYQVMLLL